MNDNWWVMQQMIEARERDIRRHIERLRPWSLNAGNRRGGQGLIGRARMALGRVLLSWGRALTTECQRAGEGDPALRTS